MTTAYVMRGAPDMTRWQEAFIMRMLPCVVIGAAIGAGTELLSPSAWDTITVPTAILIVLLCIV